MKQYRIIPLTKGYVAIIDAEDYRRVNRHSWHVHFSKGTKRKAGAPYARTTKDNKKVYLHRFVMGEPPDMHIDHRNWQTLDCRKENLIVETPELNIKRKRKKNDRCQHNQTDLRSMPEENGLHGNNRPIHGHAESMLALPQQHDLL